MISGGNELINPQKIIDEMKIQVGMKVADLGCGVSGHFVFPTAQMIGPEGIMYAVDILKGILQGIDTRAEMYGLKNVKTVWSDLEVLGATKIPEDSLDAAYLINTLFQSNKHKEMMEEGKRLLKPRGKLLVVDWLPSSASFGPPQERRVDKEKIKIIAQGLGLKLIKEFTAGDLHYGMVFVK